MRVCDVVLDSIWYDPRVRKQIIEYQNNHVEIVCVGYKDSRYEAEKVKAIPCPITLVEIDAQYLGLQKSIKNKIIREFQMIKRVRDAIIAYKPDVIHANDLNTLVASCLAAKKLKCKIIYDSHEICVENLTNAGSYKKILAFYESFFIRKIDEMVCVSHAAADYFTEKYRIKKPMVITNCSLKTERVLSEQKNDGFEVLNHGQFYAGRGYDIMVEAIPYLAEYPEIKVAFRGFGIMEEALRARARELGDENIRFYPKVLVNELILQASKSHVGVAITEGICINFKLSVSNKLFEYASAGIPVIMSDIAEHQYLNEKYHFGVIIPENTPQAFAEAVIKLYSDKKLYDLCSANARKLSDEINWENEFGRLIELERSWVND